MSDYGDYDGPRRHRSHRTRAPEYVETTYIERGTGTRDLVYRPREDSIEEISRDFPPPGAEVRQTRYREKDYGPRRARSVGRSDYSDDDDYYRRRRGRSRGRDDGYYSDDYNHPRRQRRKSIVDDIAGGLGLGGALAAITGKNRSRSRSRRRDDRYSRYSEDDYDYDSRSRSRGGHHDTRKKWQQAAQSALVAGAIEAFRSRKEPGPWTGEKGTRVATAALGAAGIDGLVDKDPDRKSKRHIAEAVIGGLAANRLANGPRGRSSSRSGRSRSRSRSRSIFGRNRSLGRSASRGRDGRSSSLKNLAGAGAIAAAGKALYDRVRSKSRSRRSRSRSSSADSYAPSRRRNYSRGRRHSPHDDVGRGGRGSSADSESTTDMENQRRKMRGKELLTAGLATVATIHAAHGVYSSMEASKKRRKLVSEGEMSREEARKRKSKNMLQDAAAVGIAALGIKSAFSEWKEMNEQRHEVHELEEKRRKRREARKNRQREARQQYLTNGAANAYGGYPGYGAPTTYADANPYNAGNAGNLPPPPMGTPHSRY